MSRVSTASPGLADMSEVRSGISPRCGAHLPHSFSGQVRLLATLGVAARLSRKRDDSLTENVPEMDERHLSVGMAVLIQLSKEYPEFKDGTLGGSGAHVSVALVRCCPRRVIHRG